MRPNLRTLLLFVLAALSPLSAVVSVSVSPTSVTLIRGQSQQFTATVTGAASPAVYWSINPVIGTISNTGLYTAPASIFQNFTITVTATSVADTTKVATATVRLVPTVGITISPTSVSLTDGQSQQFTATVTGTQNTEVTWSITPFGAGNITADGLYTAPATISGKLTVTVRVMSVADPSQSATATITLNPFVPASVSVTPATANLRAGQSQQFTANVVGIANTLVSWSVNPNVGSISPTGLYTAPSAINASQSVTVTATSLGDPTKFGTATVSLLPTAITVSPAEATLSASETQQFTAMSGSAAVTDVTWSISPSYLGSITPAGLYTAPSFISSKQTVVVTATSRVDPTRFGTAMVTLNASGVTVSPATITLTGGLKQQFTFLIEGVPSNDVFWSISPVIGSISTTGLYTAPTVVNSSQTVTVTGTSNTDSTKFARATITLTPVIEVGVGAGPGYQPLFLDAFYRNGFNNLVSLPPLGNVRRYGTTGLVQEFQDLAKTSGVRLALVKPNLSTAPPASEETLLVYQVLADVYGYYNSVGANTAGYPRLDTQFCPVFDSVNSCTYQLFDKNYALFAYKSPLFTGQNFTIRANFYLRWVALGGISGPGRPVDVETAVTSSFRTNATVQLFSGGAIYNTTSGPQNGRAYGVIQPMYDKYREAGGHAGTLGLPISEEILLANGLHRQTFEGGKIEYATGTDTDPAVKVPVAAVRLSAAAPLRMNVGDTAQISAFVSDASGAQLTDRPVTWSTSNGRVLTVQASGATATLKAVGGGSANVMASSEGKSSTALQVLVTAVCCQVGEGAPTAAIQQAFQDAVARHSLKVLLPAANPVQRVGSGYAQRLQSSDPAAPARYLLAKSDRLSAVYLIAGDILTRYEQLGGPAGSLGHPTSDPTPGGTQIFENNAALAGSPVRVVRGVLLAKWAALGYETGAAGPPAGEAGSFLTFGANSGSVQAFEKGAIYGAVSGPRSGQAFLVKPPILDRYLALAGPSGVLGMPISDEFASGETRRQNFEGGYVDYTAGDAVAREHLGERNPAVTAAPATVVAGTRARLAVSGFPTDSAIRVSVAGQPDFLVTAPTGAYSWEIYVPLNARSGVVAILAEDVGGTATAEGSYAIKSLAESRVQFAKLQGDGQSGPPGAQLPQVLRVALRDQAGNPVIGAPVVFQASPGAQISPATATTNESGQAEAVLRLPSAEGTVLATVDSPGIAAAPITFNARAAASSLISFPKLMQSSDAPLGNSAATIAQKGALLAAVASILRYHQNRGELLLFNGPAEPAALNTFLKGFCAAQVCDGFLSNPDSGEQVVNLWRLGEFVSGGVDISVERPDAAAVRDMLALGSPVLLALSLSADGAPAGGHYVVATGVAADGGILIHDPSPNFARAKITEYLAGFTAGSTTWKGELKSAVRFVLRQPGASRFLVAAISQPPALLQKLAMDVKSPAGPCGQAVELPDAAVFGAAPAAASLMSRFVACDGGQPLYQLSVGTSQPYRLALTDLASGGSVTDLSGSVETAYKLTRPQSRLAVAPQDVSFAANSPVNSATLTPGIAPGGLMTILGGGLAGVDGSTGVELNDIAARVVSASAFQVNAEVPPELAAGIYLLRVRSPYGMAEQPVEILSNAPAIFVLGQGRGAVNQDGSQNGPTSPASRGQVLTAYGTGFGAVVSQESLSIVTAGVTAVLQGAELPVSFAGLVPGAVGLYQVKVPIPEATPPGIDLPLSFRQAGIESNVVLVSLQ